MFYAIHSTLNGIIPLLTARIKGLMAFGDLYLDYYALAAKILFLCLEILAI